MWTTAFGANVEDADGNVFVDFTSGFGVAAIGHRHPQVVAALSAQAAKLIHGLGDVYPSDVKIMLLERLAQLGPWRETRVILGLSGSDAIEAALKTAAIATSRPGVLGFEGGYHGLAHGPLALCGYSEGFRRPFASQLNPHARVLPWPSPDCALEEALAPVRVAFRGHPSERPGAILVEPVQGRGGVRVPPPGFLAGLRELCDHHGALLIADEILTGLGRCGEWLLSLRETEPHLICVGKALGGGMPVSACLGDAQYMSAWGNPDGEALHTGTFFGHPLGAAAALAVLDVLDDEQLIQRGRMRAVQMTERLGIHGNVRHSGLLFALESGPASRTLRLVRQLLERGYLVLPAGADASVVQFVPPLNISEQQVEGLLDALETLVGVP
ncbi:MAG: aspartate aminotransferase family protein [Polyangiales bacterium]|nr:aspartate aminotransferase family protein [Sandaracinaceae bacterium]